MASDSSKSTPASKYDVNSQIAALLEKYFTSPTSSTRPSAVFTSGPNKGLPVSALPPSVTPFSQRGNVRRTSKVTEETNRARRQREARTLTPDQVDERRRRKENERIIREQEARARREDRARMGESTLMALFDPVEAEKASRKFRETEEFRIVNAPRIRYGNAPQSVPTPAESNAAIADRDDRSRLAGISQDRQDMMDRTRAISQANKAGSSAVRNRISDAMKSIDETTARVTKGGTAGVSAAPASDEYFARARAGLRQPSAPIEFAAPTAPYPDYVMDELRDALRLDTEGRGASRRSAQLLPLISSYPVASPLPPEGASFAGQTPEEFGRRISEVFGRLPIIRGLSDPSSMYYFPGKFY